MSYIISVVKESLSNSSTKLLERLDKNISNDMATPEILADLHELISDKNISGEEVLRLVTLYDLVLGLDLLYLEPSDLVLRPKNAHITEQEIEDLITKRTHARQNRDFPLADELRDTLIMRGVLINDESEGSTWEWHPNLEQVKTEK